MASRKTIQSRSAFPSSMTRAVLIQEVLRRLLNYSPEASWQEKCESLTEMAKEMELSGHSERFRILILEKGVEKYLQLLEDHREGRQCLYRSREEREKKLEDEGGKTRANYWYKRNGGVQVQGR